MELRRHEGKRRCLPLDDDRHQLVRSVGAPIAIEAQERGGIVHRPEDRSGEHDRAHRVKPKLELGDDPEVAAPAAQAPEEVRVLGLARLHELPVGGHQVNREELVDRQSVLSLEPADAAAQGEAGDAGVGDDPAGRREPEGLCLAVQLAPEHPGLSPCRSRIRVHPDALHRSEVDDDPAIADGQSGEAVASAADRDREAGAPREPHRRDHVRHAGASRDQGREPVDRPVPDPALHVVGGVRRSHQLPAERSFQLAQCRPDRVRSRR